MILQDLSIAHCVFLEHYYSVDFPCWFDRKLVSLVSSAKHVKCQNVKLPFVIWQKNWLCLTSLDDQIFKSFWKPNPWMNLLEKKILLYQFLFYFLQVKSFPPWMACFNSNINDLEFVTKEKLKLVKIVANWGHSR